MIDVAAKILARSEILSKNLLLIDLDFNNNAAKSLTKEGFMVEVRDLDGLYKIMRWPYDLLISCTNYESCPKEEMFGAVRQALSITDYGKKVLLFAQWGVFRDDMVLGIPNEHKFERCYALNDYGWYVWRNGRKKN